ncbi:hypothetical protein LV779_34495 [Streptomyces thinghirensis]|nr:hypothetical protein [Streptomyces thinghirensis]
MIPLSARTGEQLVARARALRDHIRAGHVGAGRLADLAFTLQVAATRWRSGSRAGSPRWRSWSTG